MSEDDKEEKKKGEKEEEQGVWEKLTADFREEGQHSILRDSYAMYGTDIAYAASRATRFLCDFRY
eukprot:3140035-Rhodomonas_salina.1